MHLYQKIKFELMQRIIAMSAHDKVPSENDLVKAYSVSRGTVKQAVTELVYEGYLYRVQGKGTFVSPPKINRCYNHLPSFTNDIALHGKTPSNRLLFLGKVSSQPQVAAKLKVDEDVEFIKYKRIVQYDDEPLAVVCSYLRCDIYPEIEAEDIEHSLYDGLLNKFGVIPESAIDTYSVLLASSKTANYLKISENDPLLYSERIGYIKENIFVEYVESFIRGDKFQLTVLSGILPL